MVTAVGPDNRPSNSYPTPLFCFSLVASYKSTATASLFPPSKLSHDVSIQIHNQSLPVSWIQKYHIAIILQVLQLVLYIKTVLLK